MDLEQSGNNVTDDVSPPDLSLNGQMTIEGDLDEEMVDATSTVPPQIDSERAPRTMRELAEEAEAYGNDRESTEDASEPFEDSPKAKSVRKPPQRRELRSGSTTTNSTPTRATRKRGRDLMTSQSNEGLNARRRDTAHRTSSDAGEPASGRTLRPRKAKTTDQLRLELENEAAIKRAIGRDSD